VRNEEGRDVSHIIIFIPTKWNPSLEDAINGALEKADGDLMTDAMVIHGVGTSPISMGNQAGRSKVTS
jgi:hypothetical protein